MLRMGSHAQRSSESADASESPAEDRAASSDDAVAIRCSVGWMRTAAILLHASVVLYILWLQVITVRGVSERYLHALPQMRRGWIAGRFMDLSDVQWRDFRKNIPVLAAAMLAFVAVTRTARAVGGGQLVRLWYCCGGVAATLYMHGAYGLTVVALAAAQFAAAKVLARQRWGGAAFWAVSVAALHGVDRGSGWYGVFGSLHPSLAWMDGMQGVYRWHVGWNLNQLRIISFAMDYREALSAPGSACTEGSYAKRQNTPRAVEDYNLISYLGYVLYPPLYIAGPITTYNAFTSHVCTPQKQWSAKYMAFYAIRLVTVLLFLDVCLHYFHPWAIVKAAGVVRRLTAAEFASVTFFLLNALWLKFAVIWRFFRLIALADGVEVPENMTRCMDNNFTVSGFWRNWHKSFNRWIVRYMYVPLGGRRSRLLSIWPIFLFVAFWHDRELQLAAWGVLMAAFMLPELVVTSYFGDARRADWLRSLPASQYIKAAAGTVNISLLIVANLVGFGVGTGTTQVLVAEVFSAGGLRLIGVTFVQFFCATCLMLEVRSWEQRQRVCPVMVA
eukprot:TRINITY_DN43311_c0_g1_i1.p1 TRINITY_DN43311_c0_g1~~TRINITY_DN43311_c0_g1_i1.p1  ORF type:complete len:558 (+),score=167.64 TRINITY_DN43311_c0_g1_i1:102-1775(+)